MEIEPKEFWDDMQCGREHYSELVKKYPDKWIAIVDKSVVAVSEGINEGLVFDLRKITKITKNPKICYNCYRRET
ncbi:MAG: hypothetical protein KAU14_03960 [Thermoplasmata archaeon]|nr:hypothetical protein [Thermoplasmata archaeon]